MPHPKPTLKAQSMADLVPGSCRPRKGITRAETGQHLYKSTQQMALLCAWKRDQEAAEDLDLYEAELMPVNPVLTSKAGCEGSLG